MHFVVLTLFPNMSTGSLMGTSSTTVISFSLTFICTQLTICRFASIVLHMFFCMLHFCKVLFVPAFLITSALEIELLLNSCLIFGFDSQLLRHRFLLVNPASFIQHQKSISRSFLYSSLYFCVKQSKNTYLNFKRMLVVATDIKYTWLALQFPLIAAALVPRVFFLFVLTMSQYLNECRYATKLSAVL